MWFIGLDWADEHHDICVITETGKQIGSLRIAHSPQGFENLKEFSTCEIAPLAGKTFQAAGLACFC